MTCGSPGKLKFSPYSFRVRDRQDLLRDHDRTGSSMRLNSSKQPHKPPWTEPLKILAMSVNRCWSVQFVDDHKDAQRVPDLSPSPSYPCLPVRRALPAKCMPRAWLRVM